MNNTAFRIQSNISVHGYAFAVFAEYQRCIRRGIGKNAARKYAVALVSANNINA